MQIIFLLLAVISASTFAASRSPGIRQNRVPAFSVADFGAKGDGMADDRPAIQKTIDAAIAAGKGTKVTFAPGKTYRLGTNLSEAAALRIGKAQGLSIIGNRAMLVTHPANRVLALHDSSDIAISDLTLDYDPLPFTQARLTKIALKEGFIQFCEEPGYADPSVGDEKLYRDFKSSDAVFLDGTTRAFTHDWGRLSSVKSIGNHVFEARFHMTDMPKRFARLKIGDFIAIKQHFTEAPALRDAEGRYLSATSANIYTTFSRNIKFTGIISHAAPGMTFVSLGSEGLVLNSCKVVRKPNTDRLIASNSDGAHFKSLTVMPRVLNCTFEALMDDSINIKISSEVVREVKGTRVLLTHGDIVTDDLVIQPGQELQFQGGATKRLLGYAKVISVERIRFRNAWVTLDKAIAGLATNDLAFLRPITDAVVSGCVFNSQLKTALVTHPPTVISKCTFNDIAYGIHSPFNSNIEGPPPQGIRVSECSFNHPSVAAIALHLPSINSAPPDRQALVVDQCRITVSNNRGAFLNAYNQEGITLRNVTVTSEDGRTRAELIRLNHCTHVVEANLSFKTNK